MHKAGQTLLAVSNFQTHYVWQTEQYIGKELLCVSKCERKYALAVYSNKHCLNSNDFFKPPPALQPMLRYCLQCTR